jgi:hypothetical protein
LESDQVIALLVGLAADGLVDFSEARLLDRNWTIKLYLLLKEYKSRKAIEVLRLHMAKSLVLLQRAPTDYLKQAAANVDMISDAIEEEISHNRADKKKKKDYNVYKELIDLYKKKIGDPNDPAHQAEISAAVEYFRQGRLEASNA